MNIFLKELGSYKKGLFFWSLGMITLVASGMAKYATYKAAGGQSITELLAQLPNSIQLIFGLSGFDLSQPSGFYGVLFIYLALMATVHAVLLGTDIIAKEERDRTTEFLFVKPISRVRVITEKLYAGLCNILLLNIITTISSIYFVNYFGKTNSLNGEIILLMTALLILQLLFFFAGTAIAAVSKKPKSSASIATAVLLFTFILSFVININQSLDSLKYLTPFRYFDAKTIMANVALDPLYVAISLVVIGILIVTTYKTYKSRDFSI
ncbi:MAG: ABC transporter permease subunit [Microcoleus sp.]